MHYNVHQVELKMVAAPAAVATAASEEEGK